MDLEKLVIDNIKRIRKKKGITQEKLAEACDMATSYIGLMEIYRNVPKLSTIGRIADALDVDPLAFFMDVSDDSPERQEKEFEVYKVQILDAVEKAVTPVLKNLLRGQE
jgi:transcriptional regulator with XRE-family HTH domain